MSNKRKGTEFERKVKEQLIKDGYYAVRSAGSFGIFDVIAIPTKKEIIRKLIMHGYDHNLATKIADIVSESILAIQCKTNGRFSKKLLESLEKASDMHLLKPMVAYKKKGKVAIKPVSDLKERWR